MLILAYHEINTGAAVLFEIYVADLQEIIDAKSYQYADNTKMFIDAEKPYLTR